MTTASDLISAAAKSIGYLGRTEVLSAADANDGLEVLNRLLDSWSNEQLMAYVTEQNTFPLVIGQQSYTIGTGGNINATRPLNILRAFIRDVNSLDYPLTIINQQQWNNIGQKNITSQIPTTLFYYSSFPLGIIYIFPVPLLAYTVYYDNTLNQVAFSGLTTSLSLPVGYERAIVLNLATELVASGWPCMLKPEDRAMLYQNADLSKGNVKRTNTTMQVADMDDYIVSKSYATYNVYSDGNPRN